MVVYSKLLNFLKKYPKEDKHTHSIYGGQYGGAYTIPFDKNDEFYRLISKSLFREKDHLSIVEKVQKICRLVIDLDFKYKDKIKSRQYNDKVLQKIIHDVFSNLSTIFNLTDEQKVLPPVARPLERRKKARS